MSWMDWMVDAGRGEVGGISIFDWRFEILGGCPERGHREMRYPFALVLDWIFLVLCGDACCFVRFVVVAVYEREEE